MPYVYTVCILQGGRCVLLDELGYLGHGEQAERAHLTLLPVRYAIYIQCVSYREALTIANISSRNQPIRLSTKAL